MMTPSSICTMYKGSARIPEFRQNLPPYYILIWGIGVEVKKKLNQAANDLAIAMNPHVFFWGTDEHGQPTVIDELERIDTVEKIKDVIVEQLEGGRFADWVSVSALFESKSNE